MLERTPGHWSFCPLPSRQEVLPHFQVKQPERLKGLCEASEELVAMGEDADS